MVTFFCLAALHCMCDLGSLTRDGTCVSCRFLTTGPPLVVSVFKNSPHNPERASKVIIYREMTLDC